jgi:hypothetical protein
MFIFVLLCFVGDSCLFVFALFCRGFMFICFCCFVGDSCLFVFVLFYRGFMFIIIFFYWCSTRFPYQIRYALLKQHTTGVTSRAGTAYLSGPPEYTTVFSGVSIAP